MIKPLGKRILVKPITTKEHKSGLILTVDSSSLLRGDVVAVSDKVNTVKVNDKIMFGKEAGLPVEDLLLLEIDNVLGVINDQP